MMNKLSAWWARRKQKKQISDEGYDQLQSDTQVPPQLDIRFSDSRHIIWSGLLIVAVFFGLGGIWISVAQISGAVVASGEVRVDSERKTVQHFEGGIVREILVRNGDKVSVGQPLLRLDSSRIVAMTDQVRLQLAASRLDEARLQAEKNLEDHVSWPERMAEIPDGNYSELLENAEKVYTSNRRSLNGQISLFNSQIDQLQQQIESLQGRQIAEEKIIQALQEELDAKLVLFNQQYIDRTRILELQRAIAEHQGQQAQLRGSQAEIREKIVEFQLRIASIKDQYRQKATTELAQVQQRVLDLQQQLLPLEDARKRLTVVAPVAGEVVALQVHSVEGVVRSGEPLMDIVPSDSPLIVESRIMVKDITHVYVGQEADVQLLAFSQRTTPKIRGKVTYVSADRILNKTPYGEQPAYQVHVELDKQQLAENDLYLTAGMPAAVFILTEPRTLLDYLLEPLTQNFERALREN